MDAGHTLRTQLDGGNQNCCRSLGAWDVDNSREQHMKSMCDQDRSQLFFVFSFVKSSSCLESGTLLGTKNRTELKLSLESYS